jgi:hypothetical protein
MPFFGLSDIKINQEPKRSGPLFKLEESQFKKDTFKYPIDVGSADKGHYVMFFCHGKYDSLAPVNNGSQIPSNGKTNRFVAGGFADQINNKINSLVSKGEDLVNQGLTKLKGTGKVGAKVGEALDNFANSGNIQSQARQTVNKNIANKLSDITQSNEKFNKKGPGERTEDVIALYMPDTIAFSSQQAYDSLRPGNEFTGQLLAGGGDLASSISEAVGKNTGFMNKFGAAANEIMASAPGKMAAQKLAGKIGLGDDSTRSMLFGGGKAVINPMLELIYSSPDFRSFQFEFFFYPRSRDEALEVQKIIQLFRYHQAPDGGGGLLIPPTNFGIKFYYAGAENPNLPMILNCVLESMDVNYAPNGFSAYEVYGENKPSIGGTGMPVGMQLTLNFKETQYITKDTIRQESGIRGLNKPNDYNWSR